MENNFQKTAEPNIQLFFWDKDFSNLSKYFLSNLAYCCAKV